MPSGRRQRCSTLQAVPPLMLAVQAAIARGGSSGWTASVIAELRSSSGDLPTAPPSVETSPPQLHLPRLVRGPPSFEPSGQNRGMDCRLQVRIGPGVFAEAPVQ